MVRSPISNLHNKAQPTRSQKYQNKLEGHYGEG